MDKSDMIQRLRFDQSIGRFNRRTFLATSLGLGTLLLAGCAVGGRPASSGGSSDNASENSALEQSDNDAQPAIVSDLPPAPRKDHPAPEFTLATLNGGQISLADYRGKPVILNFWASWCGPCRLEMPHLQSAFEENQDGDVVVLGINLTARETNSADIGAFVDEFALTFPIALDEEGAVADLYAVRGQPASVFIRPDGIINTVFYGPVNESFINDRIAEITGS